MEMTSFANNTTGVYLPPEKCDPENNTLWNWYLCISIIHAPIAIFVDRYVTPLWYIIGLFGNIVTIKIWSYRRMKRVNNSALYLIVLAFTDLMFLLLQVNVELKFAWGFPTTDVPVWCPLFFVLYMFSQYMSPLLVFGFTIERFVSIVRPFKSERFSRQRRAPKEILAITVFAIAVSIPQAHGWIYRDPECQGSDTVFFGIWTWVTDYLMFGVFPVTTFILNIFVMRAAAKATALRRESLCVLEHDSLRVSSSSSSKNKRKSSIIGPSTVTLLCISFYRIFTTLPVAVLFALQYSIPLGNLTVPESQMATNQEWQNYFRWNTIKNIINEIGLSQYSCNIFIYLLTARQFRREFMCLIRSIRTCSKPVHSDPNIIRHSTYTTNGIHNGSSRLVTTSNL